ncbi:MAG: hypothetical protein C0602_08550 [Denitrovibrio sp.]|nr:MAG: hypothetical protein C0602_08550 [Denitrovibrio sp.]
MNRTAYSIEELANSTQKMNLFNEEISADQIADNISCIIDEIPLETLIYAKSENNDVEILAGAESYITAQEALDSDRYIYYIDIEACVLDTDQKCVFADKNDEMGHRYISVNDIVSNAYSSKLNKYIFSTELDENKADNIIDNLTQKLSNLNTRAVHATDLGEKSEADIQRIRERLNKKAGLEYEEEISGPGM